MYFDPEATPKDSSAHKIEMWGIDQFKTALIDLKIVRVHIDPTAQIWHGSVLSNVIAGRCTFALFMAVISRHKNGSFSRVLAIAIRAHSIFNRKP